MIQQGLQSRFRLQQSASRIVAAAVHRSERPLVHRVDDCVPYRYVLVGDIVLAVRQNGQKFPVEQAEGADRREGLRRERGELPEERHIRRRILDAGAAEFRDEGRMEMET